MVAVRPEPHQPQSEIDLGRRRDPQPRVPVARRRNGKSRRAAIASLVDFDEAHPQLVEQGLHQLGLLLG